MITLFTPRQHLMTFRQKEKLQYMMLLLPGCILYGLFNFLPLLGTLFMSMISWSGIGPWEFIGTANYKELLMNEALRERLFQAFWQTLFLFGLCIGFFLIVGTVFSLLLSWNTAGKTYYKMVFFLPYPLAAIAIAFLGQLMVDVRGPLNQLLLLVGAVEDPVLFLGDEHTALPTIAAFYIWQKLGFVIMLILSAILGVRSDLLEAAILDGASRWQCIRHVVLPVLTPAFILITILIMVDIFNNADLVLILMGPDAGPYYSTDVMGTFQYRTAFGSSGGSGAADLGMASAIGIVIALMILPGSLYLGLKNLRGR